MTENLHDILKSLLTKLSAVRVTLTDPEQSLLDQLILGSNEEVAAQALKMTKPVATSPDEVAAQALKMTKPVATSPDEVKANRLLFLEEAKQSDTDEVSAHSMPATMLPKLGIQNPMWVMIIYDPRMECYKVI